MPTALQRQMRVPEKNVARYEKDGWVVLYWVKRAYSNGSTSREAVMREPFRSRV